MDVNDVAVSTHDDALGVIAADPPNFDEGTLKDLLSEVYGIDGRLEALVSERDQNFRVVTDAGDSYVLKVASAAEDPATTDLQMQALLHLERVNCDVGVPRIRRTLTGDIATRLSADAGRHTVRLVTYLPGVPLADVQTDNQIDIETGIAVARDIGRTLARLARALRSFRHDAERRVLLWDIQQAPRLSSMLAHIEDDAERDRVTRVLDDFEMRVSPHLASARRQIIHNDANPANILLTVGPDTRPRRVAGMIDFGDMVYAPLINDVAVAASYLRAPADDALCFVLPLVAGFDETTPLDETERLLLFDLVRARLATTICILWWRLSARDAEDPYRRAALSNESGAVRFLAALDATGRYDFNKQLADYLKR